MTKTIEALNIRPGKVCYDAYCQLNKPTLNDTNKCRALIDRMVIKSQKTGYENLIEEAIDIIREYSV